MILPSWLGFSSKSAWFSWYFSSSDASIAFPVSWLGEFFMFALGGNGGVYIILRRATFASFLVFVLLLEIICDLVGGFPPHSLHSYSSYTVCILVFGIERYSPHPHHQSGILNVIRCLS